MIMEIEAPTGEDIKKALIGRAEAFAKAQETTLSTIGLKAVNDSKFFKQVIDGRGFSINTYQKVMDWLDEQERAQESAA
jgi:hypothetical protein